MRRFRRLRNFAVAAALAACSLAPACICSQPRGQTAEDVARRQADNTSNSAQSASGSAVNQPTAPNTKTATHMSQLPQPLPKSLTQGISVADRSKAILQHLSEVIRFYRMTVTPIQKTGEPSDVLYAEQAQTTATQIAQLAFQSARDEAGLLARVQSIPGQQPANPVEGEAQRLRNAQLQVSQRIQDLENQQKDLQKRAATGPAKTRAALRQQLDDVQGQLELAQAESQALTKVFGVSAISTNGGLENDIDKLQHAVPEIIDSKIKPVANSMQSIGSSGNAGVITQGQTLFQLISTTHAIDQRIASLKTLHQQASDLRTPLENILRATLQAGRQLDANANSAGPTAKSGSENTTQLNASSRATYDQLTDAFKTVSDVAIPISQELLLLEQAQGNLLSWRSAVDSERRSIVHSLLLRVLIIALALVAIFILGEVWRRAVTRYVQDLRRRRQLLVIRRMVIGFLSGLVILLGAVTQFSSLATFAGFVTAGLAVGLQTVLLSVAAYFFIVGRYGVRVGDRITVANVTGDVVEVGLVRFYIMELAGTGSVLHPTGRIAVFANSVLFQTGTPLYKQIPGTNYAWHEVSVKLTSEADHQHVLQIVRDVVQEVYAGYRTQIERQHADVEAWMDTSLPPPGIESRIEFSDGLKITLLYPVLLSRAVETDQQVIERLLQRMASDPGLAHSVSGSPSVAAVAKAA